MDALAERARQALGIGQNEFLAANLDAAEATVEQLHGFAPSLKALHKALGAFAADTREFLDASATYLTHTPFPRTWLQAGPAEAAQALQTPVPVQHAALFDAEVHAAYAQHLPGTVEFAINKELLGVLQTWLRAYDVAQAQLAALQPRRLSYDATRRRLVAEAAKAADEAPPSAHATTAAVHAPPVPGTQGKQQRQHEATVLATDTPLVAQLQEDAAAAAPALAEFEADAEALQDLLAWLVASAARIKALLADAAGGAGAAAQERVARRGCGPCMHAASGSCERLLSLCCTTHALGCSADRAAACCAPTQLPAREPLLQAWSVPQGLMPPFPDASFVSKDVEVRLTLADAPEGAAASPPPASPPLDAASWGAGASTSVGVAAEAVPDLSAALPTSDAAVFGGGMAPPPGEMRSSPTGGGVLQLLKDTLVPPPPPPKATAEQQQQQVAQAATQPGAAAGPTGSAPAAAAGRDSVAAAVATPDLASSLPSDAMVYAGGMAPPPGEMRSSPTGGGVLQLLKDTLVPPPPSSKATAEQQQVAQAATQPGASAGGATPAPMDERSPAAAGNEPQLLKGTVMESVPELPLIAAEPPELPGAAPPPELLSAATTVPAAVSAAPPAPDTSPAAAASSGSFISNEATQLLSPPTAEAASGVTPGAGAGTTLDANTTAAPAAARTSSSDGGSAHLGGGGGLLAAIQQMIHSADSSDKPSPAAGMQA